MLSFQLLVKRTNSALSVNWAVDDETGWFPATYHQTINMFFFSYLRKRSCSETDLGSSPVSSLGVVSDLVVSSVSDPVWQSSVTLNLVADFNFSSERLD